MTISNSSLWYNLITSFKTKGEIKNGVTIPFLIGAKKLIDKSYIINGESIKELLNGIINSSVEQVAILQRCDDIRQYVIGLRDRHFIESQFKNELCFENTHGDKSLCITSNASTLGKTIEEISGKLNNMYYKDMEEKRFSWNGFDEVWRQFNDHEKELIAQI